MKTLRQIAELTGLPKKEMQKKGIRLNIKIDGQISELEEKSLSLLLIDGYFVIPSKMNYL